MTLSNNRHEYMCPGDDIKEVKGSNAFETDFDTRYRTGRREVGPSTTSSCSTA